MRSRHPAVAALLILLPVLWLSVRIPARVGHMRLELTDAETGRSIASRTLRDGEEVILTWKNSLFSVTVTEVFVASSGVLELTQITFADPTGGEPPRVSPSDVDDLYHTGGPFRAEGLSKPVSRVVFRVGEIGDPRIRIGNDVMHLRREVGFGGAVLLVARRASLYESTLGGLLR